MSFRNIQVVLSGNAAPLQTSLRAASAEVDRFASKTSGSLSGVGTASSLVTKGLVGVGVAIAASLAVAASAAAQFDREMRNVNSISKLDDGPYKALSKAVLDMSKDSTQSAETLAKGLYDIASSGFNGAEGLQVLQSSAMAAAAGMSDTATAAQAITATMNAYGRGAGDAADISDVLFQTVNLGVISFGELAGQLGDVVGMASAAKVPIEDVGAAIAAMTLAGIGGAEATTSLNRLIQSIIQPSESLASAMEQVGVSAADLADPAIGLNGVMEKLRTATGGTADAYLKLFPDIRAARGAFALAAADGRNYAKTQDGIGDATNRAGATQAAYAEQMKAVTAQAELAKNKLMAFAIEGGTHMLPVITAIISGATSLGGALGGPLRDALGAVEPLFSELVAIGGDLFQIFGQLMAVVGPVAGALALLGGTAALEVLEALATAAGAATGFLAGNKEVTLALAAALAVMLIPLSGVTIMMNRFILTPVVMAMTGMIGAIEAGTVAWGTYATAQAAATLGLSLVVAGAVFALSKLVGSVKEAREEAQKAAGDIAGVFKPQEANSASQITDQFHKASAALKELAISSQVARGQTREWAEAAYAQGMGVGAGYQEAQKKIEDLQQEYLTLMGTVGQVGSSLNLNRDQVVMLANKYGIDLTGSLDDVKSAFDAAIAKNQVESAFGRMAEASDELATGVASADDKLKALKQTFDSIIGVNLNAEEAFDNMQAKLDDLAQSFVDNGNTLSAYTEKGRENRSAIRDSVQGIQDYIGALQEQNATGPEMEAAFNAQYNGLVKTLSKTMSTKDAVKLLATQYGLVPKDVLTQIKQSGANEAKTKINDVKTALDSLRDKNVKITTTSYEIFRQGERNSAPAPASTGPRREARHTGGPVSAGNEYVVGEHEPEVFVPRQSGTILNQKQLKARETARKKEAKAAEERRRKAEEAQDRRDAAAARRRQQARDTRLQTSDYMTDPSQIWDDLVGRRTTQARAKADARAANSKNKSDTGDDYFKAPIVSLKEYQKELNKQVAGQKKWKGDLTKIAGIAGQDVADILRGMGDQGVDLVAKMAKGTKKEVEAMARTLRSLGPTAKDAMLEFKNSLHLDVAGQQQFQKDINTLIAGGHIELAQTLAAGGYEEYGQVARGAVSATPAEIAQITKDLKAQNSMASGEDLSDLITIIAKMTNDTGVIGLSRLTGLSVERELDLYNRYKAPFEAGTKGKLAAWKADMAAIAAGEQPRAYATGGIVPSSGTGTFYRWAEPESGGESLIPHGMQHRARALELWAQTGRLIGAGGRVTGASAGARSGGGGGTTVSVGQGAVRIEVRVAGSTASAAEIRDAVEGGVESALDQLGDLLSAGTGRNA